MISMIMTTSVIIIRFRIMREGRRRAEPGTKKPTLVVINWVIVGTSADPSLPNVLHIRVGSRTAGCPGVHFSLQHRIITSSTCGGPPKVLVLDLAAFMHFLSRLLLALVVFLMCLHLQEHMLVAAALSRAWLPD